MIYKRLEDIEASDLQGLCDRRVREGSQLDFKDDLPGFDDKGKVEFLRDVTALANTNGGDLIYGVIEERESDGTKTGIAAKAPGIENLNIDDRRLWMENLIRDNTEPPLIGLGIHPVTIDRAHTALVVRVPRSWNAPHVIKFGKHWRFYARNSAGNYPMNVTQLHDAFLLHSTIADKLVSFREKRVEVIKQDLRFLHPRALLSIHLQPFESVRTDANFDLQRISTGNFLPGKFEAGHSTIRINFDGRIQEFSNFEDKQLGYVQVYRSGMTEEIDSEILNDVDQRNQAYINAADLGDVLIKGVGGRLALLKEIGITSPVLLHISLLRVQGLRLKIETARRVSNRSYYLPGERTLPHPADRDDLLLKGHIIENIQELPLSGKKVLENNANIYQSWETASQIVRPLLDTIWNAFGEEKCMNYDGDGAWCRVWIT